MTFEALTDMIRDLLWPFRRHLRAAILAEAEQLTAAAAGTRW